MLFADIPISSMASVVSIAAKAAGVAFVSAKGGGGIKMPLKRGRTAILNRIQEYTKDVKKTIFVPVTDSWNSIKDIMAKDFALQLHQDAQSEFPIVLSLSRATYERYSSKEVSELLVKNSVVVVHNNPTATDLQKYREFHTVTQNAIGSKKVVKIFPAHIQTVFKISKALPKQPRVFVDAGAGFQVFDQVKHYLDKSIIASAIVFNADLAKSEEKVIAYMYDNASKLGFVFGEIDDILREVRPSVADVITTTGEKKVISKKQTSIKSKTVSTKSKSSQVKSISKTAKLIPETVKSRSKTLKTLTRQAKV